LRSKLGLGSFRDLNISADRCEQRDVLVCEDCLIKKHEDHYAEEMIY